MRLLPRVAGGNFQAASEDMRMVQIATSVSGRDAHEFGGGAGAFSPSSTPATTVISVVRPTASLAIPLGTALSQSMAKYGSANLSSAGRLSQIWKSSSGFGPFEFN